MIDGGPVFMMTHSRLTKHRRLCAIAWALYLLYALACLCPRSETSIVWLELLRLPMNLIYLSTIPALYVMQRAASLYLSDSKSKKLHDRWFSVMCITLIVCIVYVTISIDIDLDRALRFSNLGAQLNKAFILMAVLALFAIYTALETFLTWTSIKRDQGMYQWYLKESKKTNSTNISTFAELWQYLSEPRTF